MSAKVNKLRAEYEAASRQLTLALEQEDAAALAARAAARAADTAAAILRQRVTESWMATVKKRKAEAAYEAARAAEEGEQ